MHMLSDAALVLLVAWQISERASEYDGCIRRECYSGSMVTVQPGWPATLRLRAALSRHPTLIKGVYAGYLIRCDNRPGSDSNLKPNTH